MKKFKEVRHTLAETRISLQYHDTLNPKLWTENRLHDDVRERLLQIGNMFADNSRVPRNVIRDIILTGGNANYNYTDKSDVDVHVVINKDALGMSRDWLDDYFQDKKTLWSIKHGFTIHGLPVELYVQDYTEVAPAGQGVFSLLNNTWIQLPTHQQITFNDPLLKRKVMSYVHQIDGMIKNNADVSAFKELRKRLKDMRGSAISKGGEFSFENLVFKELRNRGYLDKVNKHLKSLEDKAYSI